MSSFGGDVSSHLSMSVSLHIELNWTYGTSKMACFVCRHISSIAFGFGHPDGRNSSSAQPGCRISSATNLNLCFDAPSAITKIFPNLSHAVFKQN